MDALKVTFRADRYGSFKNSITAVFPTESQDYAGNQMTCYEHVGQHSGCTLGWYRNTRPATPAEYGDLLAELRGIYESGEDAVALIVVKRITRADHDTRYAQARAARAAVQANPAGAPWTPQARAEAFAPA